MHRLTNSLIVVSAIFIGFLLAEVASRYTIPISPGAQLLTSEGDPVAHNDYKANTRYRQFSSEFDAVTTIDRYGNRIPTPDENPRIIFIGDSFTFGHGLADSDTFVAIYCSALELSCANLGKPGFGTTEELDRLEYFLTDVGWRPDIVKLVFFGMTGTLMSGNDLYDNYLWASRNAATVSSGAKASYARNGYPASSPQNRVRDFMKLIKNLVLEHSNLGRFFYFTLGNQVRSLFSPPASQKTLESGLLVTRNQIQRLTKLSEIYGFGIEIFVIHPVQDLIRRTSDNTIHTLQNSIPGYKFASSAKIFAPNPSQYYFSYDGHFNAKGAKKFAEFLIKNNVTKR
jgi:hypothetical protein